MWVKVCVRVFTLLMCEIVHAVNISMSVNVYIGVYMCECKGVFKYVSLRRWMEKSFLLFCFFSLFFVCV